MKKLKKFWVRQNSYKDWPMIITSLIGLPESPYNYRPGVMPLPRTIFISKKIRERLIFYMNFIIHIVLPEVPMGLTGGFRLLPPA